MPDQHDTDIKTRANLAYGWSISLNVLIGYALVEYGHILAVLTLIIGFITGTAATVLAVYFGSQITGKKPDPTVPVTGDNPNITVNPSSDGK